MWPPGYGVSFHRHRLFLFAGAVKFQCPPNRPFRCKNDRVCLWIGRQCDGIDNCGDNTDEKDCGEWGRPRALLCAGVDGAVRHHRPRAGPRRALRPAQALGVGLPTTSSQNREAGAVVLIPCLVPSTPFAP